MKTVLALIRKEYRLFLGDRVAVSLTFIVPIVLIALWGTIFGSLDSGPHNLRLAFFNHSTAPIARRIEEILDTTSTFQLIKSYKDENGQTFGFDSSSIQEYVRKGNVAAALVIPSDAYTDTSFGLKLKFYYDPRNQMEMQILQGVLQQTIATQLPQIFLRSGQLAAREYLGPHAGNSFNGEIAGVVGKYFNVDPERILQFRLDDSSHVIQSSGQRNFFSDVLKLEKVQLVGQDIENPQATRSVGGWAIMFLLFSLTASSTSLFDEKRSGVVFRILSSPVSRAQILWSKYLFNMSLGCLQLLALFAAGALLFKIDVLSNLPNLVLIIIASSVACTAFGMLLAAFSKTHGQAQGLGTLLILAMSSMGGAWFPTFLMPPLMQLIGKFTIVYWSMDGILQVLWRKAGTAAILPHLGVLLGVGVVISAISLWQFKKGQVF